MQDRICQVDETSCNARPDHTFGSDSEVSLNPVRSLIYPESDARFFDADMRNPSAIDRMMADVANWGGPDILVNNSGIQHTVSLAEATRQVWDDIIAVNLSGAFYTMRPLCLRWSSAASDV
jgi:NAD(P)-dependent dehydrogenase (short-subunit alcohol dehydrogenase family)